ncbi:MULTISPECIES: hypothetical protein [Paenibacillus]|jgi:hypothetical protein|uniref:Uncharacterized protein n=3 Tax=Paenibacillus TaxID=44249 RepID=A0A919YFS3_9BACL|nr:MULTISPECIES: hypothetical protein [Paenibacillus]MBP1905009.1 hypothetical protein [Paenibacillus turicensis]GGF89226.1 hypothetical protein GCM10010913_08280 [Paenibacillus aceti]GIO49649.1 hypothetical protein J34TS1_44140 [Paenibacillus azoreducens]
MKLELKEKLFTRFPWSIPDKSDTMSPWTQYTFECGDGWYQILWDMFTEIEEVYKNNGIKIKLTVGQIKQKFGELRVYIHDALPEVNELIVKYQEISVKICEGCGIESSIQRRVHYWTTLCDDCYDKRIEEARVGLG